MSTGIRCSSLQSQLMMLGEIWAARQCVLLPPCRQLFGNIGPSGDRAAVYTGLFERVWLFRKEILPFTCQEFEPVCLFTDKCLNLGLVCQSSYSWHPVRYMLLSLRVFLQMSTDGWKHHHMHLNASKTRWLVVDHNTSNIKRMLRKHLQPSSTKEL